MSRSSQLISAIMTLTLGILFIILKTDVIGIALTVLGVALIITAVLDLIRKGIVSGIIKALLGVAVLVIGWLLIDIAIIILGIVLLVYGILNLVKRVFAKKKGIKLWKIVIGIIEPVLCIIAAVFLITSSGTALEWTVLVGGIILIINGALALVGALTSKK